MFFGREEEKPNRSTQIELYYGDERLYFIGLRLGYLHLLEKPQLSQKLATLGPEPLESTFTLHTFQSLIAPKRSILKTLLVDQGFISGIGNCYSDEICFEAGILPLKKANELTTEEIMRLYNGMKVVLNQAIQFGGYMEMPLFVNDTLTGDMTHAVRCMIERVRHVYAVDKKSRKIRLAPARFSIVHIVNDK